MKQKQDIFTLFDGRVKFARGRYNPTSDTVYLAQFAESARGTVLDVGIGPGGVSLGMISNNPDLKITGIDISREMLDECEKNCELNSVKFELINADILTWKTDKTFDNVVSNPPYFFGTSAKHNAHHNVNIFDWTVACLKRVKPRGYLYMIMDAGVVADAISGMNTVAGDIQIIPLFTNKNTAERVLISCRLGTKTPTKIFRFDTIQ